ncbi:MAG: hypothetical protein IJD78_00220 [Clostridia bacterium]|nr:hypothetical protein [Clostridia bacterium]
MKKRIIAAALAVMISAGLCACEKNADEKATESDAQAVSSTVTEAVTQASTTAPVTTTVPATTEPTTAKQTTTKKIVTTTKKVATTVRKALTTKTVTEEKTEKRTKINSLLERRKEEESVSTDLKYGVIRHQVITTYYEEQPDGTEKAVRTEVTADVIDRTFYFATYNDLLPAAKQNRETYRSEIREILKIINGYRAEGGLEPLTLNEDLTIIACARAEEIAWSGNHTHTRPNYSSCFTLMRENGFEKGTAGENIGWGFSDPESVCEAWKESETHYENIMNPKFTEVGIGVAADPDKDRNLCWSQYFYAG